MKKCLIISFLMLMVLMVDTKVFAESNEITDNDYNLLDLSLVKKNKDKPYLGHSDQIVDVVPNDTYTLVVSYDFIGSYVDLLSGEEFEIEMAYDYQPFTFGYTYDTVDENVYVEFEPINDFTLFSFPFVINNQVPNYEIVLYRGNYDDFDGFEPYLGYEVSRYQFGEIELQSGQLLTSEQIYALISAHDAENQNINYEIIYDEYTLSDKKPGTYEIKLLAQVNQIKKYFLLTINVMDTEIPEIIGPDTLHVKFGEEPSLSEIFLLFTVTDNADELTYDDFVIEQENYSYATTVGTYQIHFNVSDDSGNTAYYTLTVYIEDEEAPIINGPEEILLYATDEPLLESNIIDLFSATDDVDEIVDITISSNEYLETTNPGIYEVLISAIDSSNNQSTTTLYIHVIENRGATFEFEEPIMEISNKEFKNDQDLLIYFKNYMNKNDQNIEDVSIVYNEYTNHENTTGAYYVYFDYSVEDETFTTRMLVEVVDETNLIDYWYIGVSVSMLGALITYVIIKKKKKI